MPGLIDAHFHAYSPTFDIYSLDRMPMSLLANHASVLLEGALRRGFTSVRDAGGADIGLALATEAGLIVTRQRLWNRYGAGLEESFCSS